MIGEGLQFEPSLISDKGFNVNGKPVIEEVFKDLKLLMASDVIQMQLTSEGVILKDCCN